MKNIFIVIVCLMLTFPVLGMAADNSEKTVILNVKSLIYHAPHCTWAKRCTKNCVKTTLDKAHKAGARACKVCGGGKK